MEATAKAIASIVVFIVFFLPAGLFFFARLQSYVAAAGQKHR
jgi:hypothetical protein